MVNVVLIEAPTFEQIDFDDKRQMEATMYEGIFFGISPSDKRWCCDGAKHKRQQENIGGR